MNRNLGYKTTWNKNHYTPQQYSKNAVGQKATSFRPTSEIDHFLKGTNKTQVIKQAILFWKRYITDKQGFLVMLADRHSEDWRYVNKKMGRHINENIRAIKSVKKCHN
ncbi:unnamed protein product [marine sediment metagenome]|uniref:Uncharacterized protein n=1 Tax=marine sediment metagenome TaxID=412755 RepID=X1FCD7_9ZZZZ